MAHKIHELKATKGNEEANLDCIIWPCGWCVLRMNQEVHCSNTEQYPIMSTVLKHIEKWHGIIREPMHEKCFQLSLYVMQEKHSDTNFFAWRYTVCLPHKSAYEITWELQWSTWVQNTQWGKPLSMKSVFQDLWKSAQFYGFQLLL